MNEAYESPAKCFLFKFPRTEWSILDAGLTVAKLRIVNCKRLTPVEDHFVKLCALYNKTLLQRQPII